MVARLGATLALIGTSIDESFDTTTGESEDLQLHIGSRALGDLEHLLERYPRAAVSTVLRDPESIDLARAAGPRLNILFVDHSHYASHRANASMRTLAAGRIVVLSSAGGGLACLVDGVPVFAWGHSSRSEPGPADDRRDGLAASFVSALVARRELAQACALAAAPDAKRAPAGASSADGLLGGRESLATPGPHAQKWDPDTGLLEATAIFVFRDDQLLLVRKPEEKAFVPGLLYVPGGKRRPDESYPECARRELFEETGLRGGDLSLIGVFTFRDPRDDDRRYLFYQYALHGAAGDAAAADDVSGCLWVPTTALPRERMFDLTWAQLLVADLLGTTGLDRRLRLAELR